MDDNITSAKKVSEAFEKGRIEEENKRAEKEKEYAIQFEIISNLKKQNALLEKEYKDSQIELAKSKKINLISFILSIIFGVATIISTVVAILK